MEKKKTHTHSFYWKDEENSYVCQCGTYGVRIDLPLRSEGVKYDEDRLRMDLIPPYPLMMLAQVYTLGAKKYGVWNWTNGMSWMRLAGAMLRHLYAWISGEKYDKGDGQHHLASVAWGALTLMQYELDHVQLDDRPFRIMACPIPPAFPEKETAQGET